MKLIIVCKAASVATPSPISCKVWVRGTTHYSFQEEKPPKQVPSMVSSDTSKQHQTPKVLRKLANVLQKNLEGVPQIVLKMENMGKSCRRHVDVFALAMGDPGRARAKILAAEFVTSFCLSVTTSWSLPHGPYLQTDVMLWCCKLHLKTSQWFSMSNTTLTSRVL